MDRFKSIACFIAVGLFVVEHSAAADTRFAVIGDYNVSTKSGQVASRLKTFNPETIFTVGDNIYTTGGSTAEFDSTIGQYYEEFIKYPAGSASTYAVPSPTVNNFFPAIGNHDIDAGPSPSGGLAGNFTNYFELPGNERYYDVVRGNVHLFVLASDKRDPDGQGVGSIQRTWFNSALANSTSDWNIVLFHHPAYSTSAGSGDHSSNSYMQWGFGDADIVFNGHSHDYERNTVGGKTYIVDGTGGNTTGGFPSSLAAQGIVGTTEFRDTSNGGKSYNGFSMVDATDEYLISRHYSWYGNYQDHVTKTQPGTPSIQMDVFTSGSDTELRQSAPSTSLASASDINVDAESNSGLAQGLIRFSNVFGDGVGQVPLGATITSAWIRLNVSNEGSGLTAHQMLVDWNDSATWDSLGSGVQTSAEAASTYDITTGLGDHGANLPMGILNLDVTNSLQNWADGAANYGWALLPLAGGTNGTRFDTFNHDILGNRPSLFVEYFMPVPEPSTFLLGLLACGYFPRSLRQRRRLNTSN